MENLERQLEEIEVLQAIYPDELTVDTGIIESAKQLIEGHRDGNGNGNGDNNNNNQNLPETNQHQPPRIFFTIHLTRLASLEPSRKLKYIQPSITIEFPPEYPETSPPLVIKTFGLDTELVTIVQTCLEEHSGEEATMQLVMAINEDIQTRNESTAEDHETIISKKEQEKIANTQHSGSSPNTQEGNPNNCSTPVIGRRIINSPYILKPAKIKDIKKCADELKLGGYAKVGKPGIIVIEGPEEGCKQYCPELENRGWKYQKVQGEQQEEGPAGGSVDELRVLHNTFEVLGDDKDAMSELGRLCRSAGIADLFFSSLNIHDSFGGNAKGDHRGGAGRKGGKR